MALQWHYYRFDVPGGAPCALAANGVCPQAYRLGELAWGLQFHRGDDAARTGCTGSTSGTRSRTSIAPASSLSALRAEIDVHMERGTSSAASSRRASSRSPSAPTACRSVGAAAGELVRDPAVAGQPVPASRRGDSRVATGEPVRSGRYDSASDDLALGGDRGPLEQPLAPGADRLVRARGRARAASRRGRSTGGRRRRPGSSSRPARIRRRFEPRVERPERGRRGARPTRPGARSRGRSRGRRSRRTGTIEQPRPAHGRPGPAGSSGGSG